VFDAANGNVRYPPDAADLITAENPLRMRWKVTDGLGQELFHHSGRPAVVVTHEV
jgi:hypothetical protein